MNFSTSRRPLVIWVATVLAVASIAAFFEPSAAFRLVKTKLKQISSPVSTLTTPAPQAFAKPTPMRPVPLPDTGTSQFRKLIVKNLGPVINSSSEDFGPTVTADGRTMYFVSRRKDGSKGYDDFWGTTNPSGDDTTWTAPVNMESINSELGDGAASIAADGQTIYFATNRGTSGTNDMNIWVATLDGHEWKNMHEVGSPINTNKWESQPAISPDGKKLFFASNRPGRVGNEKATNLDIFVSHQMPDGRWGEPVNLGSTINTSEYDGSPFMAADGQTLYFCSNGHGGEGQRDIFMSEFKGPSDTDWTTPVALPPPINSPANEMFLTIPASGNVLFFSSDRGGGSGALDIYVAFNPPQPKPTLVLRGICYDVNTNEKLAAHVVITDEQTGDTVYNKQANSETGEYVCVLTANKQGYLGGSYMISATEPNHFPYPATRENIPLRNDSSRVITHDIPMNNEVPPEVRWVTETPELLKEPGMADRFSGFKGLIVRERLTVELYALLPMIFFDPGQSTFPSRYVLFTDPAQTNGFSEDTISATLNGYYNYLNCLGLRLRKHPDAKITLIGCNSQQKDNDAEKSTDLSRARAENVKKYLVDIWGIDASRLPIEARGLPANSTLSTTIEGIEENRRVEVSSDDWEIIKPIRKEMLVKYPDFRTAKFSMKNGIKDDRVKSRELSITHNGQEWAHISDLGPVSAAESPEWNWRSDADHKLPADETDFGVQLLVTDVAGKVHKSNVDLTGVRQFSQKDVAVVHMKDKTQETYNLILFKYNSSEMGKWNSKILNDYVFDRIKPASDVQVNGYTDNLGTPDYNLKLSSNRASATLRDIQARIKNNVHTLKATGYGKGTAEVPPLYPNQTPEGRYYNRTVQVVIETPINQ
ncbi:MAG: PD40 domain-containing protein [Bacteroidetes bacterium]|nr:PD40 domain-containing protein [Bacteroidota bacterium]